MSAQLQFRDVTLGYDRHPAVHHLSGEVATGALLAVVGPNGAGKSTLFRGLVGILKPLAGTIVTGGIAAKDIAYLPQSADIDRSFPISVFDFVGTGLWRRTGFFGGVGKEARGRIARALSAVGLSGFENRGIGTLSGGQMQRMLFARVLLQDARLIVLDEPFNAIDTKTSADLMALVADLPSGPAEMLGPSAPPQRWSRHRIAVAAHLLVALVVLFAAIATMLAV